MEKGHRGAGIDKAPQEDAARWDYLRRECQLSNEREELTFGAFPPIPECGELFHEEGEFCRRHSRCLGHCVQFNPQEGDARGGRRALCPFSLDPEVVAERLRPNESVLTLVRARRPRKKEVIQIVDHGRVTEVHFNYVF